MTRQFKTFSIIVSALILLVVGCKPESAGELGNPADASFTVAPIVGRTNTFLVTSTSVNAFAVQWDKAGNGNYAKGKFIDTVYFGNAGVYRIGLRAFGRGGYDTASAAVVVLVDDLMNIPTYQKLVAKTWKLDATPGANAIIVGTDGNPGQYFGGGGLDGCQTDDTYKFGTDLKLVYAANGATFNGSNIAPNFTCGTDRSYTNTAYTFQMGATGAGIATITLPGQAVPARFIGVTDVSSNNYRIISISDNAMVLRSGTSTETVHQFKFVAQ
jgi:hypothetical protein